jgi:hypothetical protein
MFLFASGGVTVAAIAVCAVEYASALSAENTFNAASGKPVSVQAALLSSYDNAQTLAYGTLAASIGLAAITGGLTVWYFAGTTHEVSIAPVAGPTTGGAQGGIVGRF